MPRRPEGVRVHRADGSQVICELAYAGFNEADGVDEWRVLTPIGPGDRVAIDLLPGKTAVFIPTVDGA